MARPLNECVVVITGASGGIGRATAREFAQTGATVALAARRTRALEATAKECRSLGGRALAVPTDVSDADAVDRLADTAIDTYGRIDVWVNNAAVSLFGRLEEVPRAEYERVIQANLFGYVNGSRAGNPFEPDDGDGRVRAGWAGQEHPVQARVARHPAAAALCLAALALPLGLLAPRQVRTR